MITNALFEDVLLDPAEGNKTSLYIVSGYSTAAMAYTHLSELEVRGKLPEVNLIIGMTSKEGIDSIDHQYFKDYMMNQFKGCFNCRYMVTGKPVHTKLYVWLFNGKPHVAWAGSANYTQAAFLENEGSKYNQRELLTSCSPKKSLRYYQSIKKHTLPCVHADVEQKISIKGFKGAELESFEHISVPLVDKKGEVQHSAGLNWGFRQDGKSDRNKNEAYIQLRPDVYKSEFFPPRANNFSVYTDDNKKLVFTRAQKDWRGHALETPYDNSKLGRYFRKRLGLSMGSFVERKDLDKYGRIDVDFYRINSETFYMDFSVSSRS